MKPAKLIEQTKGLRFRLYYLPIVTSLHCTSFLRLPFRILNIGLVKPKKGTTMETTGTSKPIPEGPDVGLLRDVDHDAADDGRLD